MWTQNDRADGPLFASSRSFEARKVVSCPFKNLGSLYLGNFWNFQRGLLAIFTKEIKLFFL